MLPLTPPQGREGKNLRDSNLKRSGTERPRGVKKEVSIGVSSTKRPEKKWRENWGLSVGGAGTGSSLQL